MCSEPIKIAGQRYDTLKLVATLRHSLAARLLGVFLVTGIAVLLVISLAWGMALKYQWNSKIRPHLVQYVDYVNRDLGNPPDPRRADELVRQVPVNIYIKGPGIDYTSTGRTLDMSEVDFDDDEDHHDHRHDNRGPPWRDKRMTTASGVEFMVGDYDHRTLVRTMANGYTTYYELRHRESASGGRNAHRPGTVVFFCTLGLLLALLALCFMMIHRLLRPVRDIQAGVAQMGRGALDHRITTRSSDDLGDLANSINEMAGDIEQMLDAKRQMLLAISHELRSPITRAKVSVELLEPSSTRARLEDDLVEMESLVTELLESERLNSRHSVLHPEAIDIADLVGSVVAQNFEGCVVVDVAADIPTINIDETRTRLLLRNLLGNAVRYAGDAESQLRVRWSTDRLTIEVQDSGEGIAAEHIDSLTEPFYRIDPSRTRATGGFGLGLYLCRLICEAHGGTLTIDSTPGVGTTVTATLKSQIA